MIPRLLHQIFIPDGPGSGALDGDTLRNVESWKLLHPGHCHRLWDVAGIRALAGDFDRRLLAALDACAFPAMKADIARLLILLLQGGTYADLGFRCLRPFLAELEGRRLVLLEHFPMGGVARHRYLSNGLILAEAGHPLLRQALADCLANVEARLDTGVWNTTGPRVLMRLQDEFLPQPYGCFVDGQGVLAAAEVYGRLLLRTGGGYNRAGRHWREREARESLYVDREVRAPRRPVLRPQAEAEQAAFFEAALARTREAEARAGAVERCFGIAGATLSVRFASAALEAAFVPALAHLEMPAPAPADAVIHVWDSHSADTPMVPPPFTQGCLTGRGEIWTMASRRYRSAYLWGEHALALYDAASATGLYWTPSPGPMPSWAKAAPLRCLLHWWAQSRGCQLVHGAAAGDARGAVLIVGRSGMGKSTTALACLQRGLRYLGDDYVLLQPDPEPRVHSLYATAKLDPAQLGRFPGLAALPREHRDGEAKAVLYLHPAASDQLAASLPLRAIVTPRFAGEAGSALESIPPGELRQAAVLTTLAQLPQAGPETHDLLARLVGRLPGWRLALGREPGSASEALAGLLVAAAPAAAKAPPGAPPPLVSIVIAVGEDGGLLAETIDSVLAPAGADIELLLVEDEEGARLDPAIARLPIEVRRLRQPPAGPASAFNRGLRECGGALVAFLRAGDRWAEGTLTAMLDALPGCDAVHGLGEPGEPAAALYRREAFERVGPFDERLWHEAAAAWLERARAEGLRLAALARPALLAAPRPEDAARRLRQERRSLLQLKAMLDRRRAARPTGG